MSEFLDVDKMTIRELKRVVKKLLDYLDLEPVRSKGKPELRVVK